MGNEYQNVPIIKLEDVFVAGFTEDNYLKMIAMDIQGSPLSNRYIKGQTIVNLDNYNNAGVWSRLNILTFKDVVMGLGEALANDTIIDDAKIGEGRDRDEDVPSLL